MGIDIREPEEIEADEKKAKEEKELAEKLKKEQQNDDNDEVEVDDLEKLYAPDRTDWDWYLDNTVDAEKQHRKELILDRLACVVTNHTHGMSFHDWKNPNRSKQVDRFGDYPYSHTPSYEDTYLYLNQLYHELLRQKNRTLTTTTTTNENSNKNKKDDGFPPEEIASNWKEEEEQKVVSGMKIPYEVNYNIARGRGIYATADIDEGTLIWSPNENNIAIFDPSDDFRFFVESILMDGNLSTKQANQLACDVTLWSYGGYKKHGLLDVHVYDKLTTEHMNGTKTVTKKSLLIHDTVHCLKLDDGNLFNHADPEAHAVKHNMEFRQMMITDDNGKTKPIRRNNFNCGYGYGLYATRDIRAGEELSYDYDANGQETPDDPTEMDELSFALMKEKRKKEIAEAKNRGKEYKKFVRYAANPDKNSGEEWIIDSDEWDAWYANPIREQSDLLRDISDEGDRYNANTAPPNILVCPNANDTHGIIDNFYNGPEYSFVQGLSNGMQHYSRFPTRRETWEPLRDNYLAVTSKTSPRYKEARKSFVEKKNKGDDMIPGFTIPYEIRYDEKVGRGVFAKTLIKEGSLVWHPRNVAEFYPQSDFRNFVERLKKHNNDNRYVRSLACDSILWSTTRSVSRYDFNDKMVCLPLDDGALINDGFDNRTANNLLQRSVLDDDDVNEVIDDDERYTCRDNGLYAKRDIQPGEELRYAYDPKHEEIEIFKPTLGEWKDYLTTGGVDELQTVQEKKDIILDAMHCNDDDGEGAEYDYIYDDDDWIDLFEYYTSTFDGSESRSAIQKNYNVTDPYSTSAFYGYPIYDVRGDHSKSFLVKHEVKLVDDGDNSDNDVDDKESSAQEQQRRGVFATENIPKGTKIWEPTRTVQFFPVVHYYRFVEKMLRNGDTSLSCDVVNHWSYNTDDGKAICVNFDDSSMMNGVELDTTEEKKKREYNVGWKSFNENESVATQNNSKKYYKYEFGCQAGGSLFATRDIQKGEELVYWRPKPNPEE